MKNAFTFIATLFSIFLFAEAKKTDLEWRDFSADIFAEAKANNKIILLNLEANWCHWCHVMEDSTYSNNEVIQYIKHNFIPVKADQDAHPELSIRYKNYGWPATIFINQKGQDVVKRAGYIEPENFLRLLKAIVADPSPERGNIKKQPAQQWSGSDAKLLEDQRKIYLGSLDFDKGGFAQAQKYVEWETFEYALYLGNTIEEETWLQKSVAGAKKLADTAWGGIYQYSTHYDWQHLHFEKLLKIQARYLRIFTLANAYFEDAEAMQKSREIVAYCNRFLLRPNGLFANAQDADLIPGEHAEDYFSLGDKARLKKGIPAVDTNTFTQRNAQFAVALWQFNLLEKDKKIARQINRMAQQLLLRKANNGLYYHSAEKREIFSLKDQIAVAEFWKILAQNDAKNGRFQSEFRQLLNAMHDQYLQPNGSAKSYVGNNGLNPRPIVAENIKLARLFNWYAAFAEAPNYKETAKGIYRYLTHPAIAAHFYTEPELLLLQHELTTAPFENVLIYVNHKPQALVNQAHAMAPYHSIFSAFQRNKLPAEKLNKLPVVEQHTIFICTDKFCSAPLQTALEVANFYKR